MISPPPPHFNVRKQAGGEPGGDAAHLEHERGGRGEDHPAPRRPPSRGRCRQYQEISWLTPLL